MSTTTIPLILSDVDEKLMRSTLGQCYSTYSRGFHVSAEHYRYLAEQIVSLREHIKRMGVKEQRLRKWLENIEALADPYEGQGLFAKMARDALDGKEPLGLFE